VATEMQLPWSIQEPFISNMSKKKTFVLRIDPEMYKAVEKWASDEFRSTNGQIEWILAKSLRDARRSPKKKKGDDHSA